jgi:hypothetical protein
MAAPEKMETPQIVNLSQTTVDHVQAELVRASLTGIQQLHAEEAELHESAAGLLSGKSLTARRSIIGLVNTGSAVIEQGLTGAVRAENLSVKGKAGVAVGNALQAEDLNAILVAGGEVRAANIRSGLIISRAVHGNVETLLDARSALLAGLVGGVVAGLLLMVGRLLFGRRK